MNCALTIQFFEGQCLQLVGITGVDRSHGDGSDTDTDTDSDLEVCMDPNYEFPERTTIEPKVEVYPIEKRKEILMYWRSGTKNKNRKLAQVQHKYTKVASFMQLYRWEKQIADGDF